MRKTFLTNRMKVTNELSKFKVIDITLHARRISKVFGLGFCQQEWRLALPPSLAGSKPPGSVADERMPHVMTVYTSY